MEAVGALQTGDDWGCWGGGGQYSLWLDQHNMDEVLQFIKSALKSCSTAAELDPAYDDVGPLMFDLVERSQQGPA